MCNENDNNNINENDININNNNVILMKYDNINNVICVYDYY